MMPSIRSSNRNSVSDMSLTGSNTSSQRSNNPALLRLYSYGSQKLNQIAGHLTPQIGQKTSNESQYYIPSPISSPTIPSGFKTFETYPENFDNHKPKSNQLPLPKLLSRSTSKVKKVLQDFQHKNPPSKKPTDRSSFHQTSSKTHSTVPQSNQVNRNTNINKEDQSDETPKLTYKKGLMKFDQKEFIEQKAKAKETLELDEDLRLFEISVTQIKRQREESEHKELTRKTESKNQTTTTSSSFEVPTQSYLKVNSFQAFQTHSKRSSSINPPRNEISEPLVLEINNNTQEDSDEEEEEEGFSLYKVTTEQYQYELKEKVILPQWPTHL
ncbi:uncharacterized protein MELLADRAFT_114871 [Melampsora larici-populina 98AG31]|uniref:Uncharacterized protein n=1 Tax=Melampsora larici-populina (strain 98AG31 / pathotype 3-4-7) TaxID=747676 RepID=F4R3U3_MELLP|nr:uncharacterized protein MELLADRAFT_114871 [Melampsora larici-populina 98AG31]EGG12686.1 hypothetical protein MELLADRAFT_114871 [Melampsora larici-populina 98AG31]